MYLTNYWTMNLHFSSLLSQTPMKIMPNILHHVGNTPLVRLNRIGKEEGIKCDLRKYLAHLDVLDLQN